MSPRVLAWTYFFFAPPKCRHLVLGNYRTLYNIWHIDKHIDKFGTPSAACFCFVSMNEVYVKSWVTASMCSFVTIELNMEYHAVRDKVAA